MIIEDFLEQLSFIKGRILKWPYSFEDNDLTHSEKMEKEFKEVERHLSTILSTIKNFSKQQQEYLTPHLDKFYDEVGEHQKIMKQQLNELKEKLNENKTHLRAIKAYNR